MVGNAINFIKILSGGLGAADEGGLKNSLSWLNSSTTFCLLHLGHFLDSTRRGDVGEFPTLQLTIITDKSGNFIKFHVSIHSLTQSTVVAQISLRGHRFRSNNLANLAGDRFSFCSPGFPLTKSWCCLAEFNQWAETKQWENSSAFTFCSSPAPKLSSSQSCLKRSFYLLRANTNNFTKSFKLQFWHHLKPLMWCSPFIL